MTKQEEINLTQRIQSGDSKAEGQLFARFDERICRKIQISIGVENDDWKDILSEVKIALLKNLRDGKFDAERNVNLGSYIFGITMNKIRDYYKQQKKDERILNRTTPILDPEDCQEDEQVKQELHSILKKLIQNLKLKYKEVLYLRYYEEMTIAQISNQINLPPRRVSERINYALKLLRKECEKEKYFSIFSFMLIIY